MQNSFIFSTPKTRSFETTLKFLLDFSKGIQWVKLKNFRVFVVYNN
jgi:hypothetical protein